MTVAVPESGLSVGESVEFTVEQSNGPYSCCVPLTALYGQEGQEYVFVVDTVDSILGEVQVARKISVQVKEKNQTTAALAEGTLSSQEGQEYVFVVDTVDSILGEVQVARKISVQVKEKNQTTAALAEGTLSSSQKVITEANREIQDGSRVRLQQS